MSTVAPPRPAPTAFAAGVKALDVRTTTHLLAAIDAVLAEMAAFDYPARDTFGVRLALEEVLVNVLKHGHGYDPGKVARLRYRVSADEVLAEVRDEGPGFDPREVADPCLPENRERSCGRGLLLIRHYLTSVQYNASGNCVLRCKARSGGG